MPRDPAAAVVVLLAGLAILMRPAVASPAVQTFGPGKVNCQSLIGPEVDCLLAGEGGMSGVAGFGAPGIGDEAAAHKDSWEFSGLSCQ